MAIVGVGASAGGLEALSALLAHVPGDTGLALVVVQHLDPTHTSLLSAALGRAANVPVLQARSGLAVSPDHAYVIPPNTELSVTDGVLELRPRKEPHRPHMPVDFLFRSLAAAEGSRAVGVVLSGTGSDGTEGMRAIKAAGGTTFAQDPATARFGGMPESALAAGVVDATLTVEAIAAELARLGRHPYMLGSAARRDEAPASRDGDALQQALAAVRSATGIDFAGYKPTTIRRRLARRMALLRVESLDRYAATLQDDKVEARALSRDVLIHVTGFFRDPEAFEALERLVLPELVARHADGSPLRVWVPACSSGEEVYSLAIGLVEALGAKASTAPVQLFGSDVSQEAIDRARAGRYSKEATRGLSQERLARHFRPTADGYCIAKELRDLCVFVRHDVVRDPPFARLDLVSCRNLLIYFGKELQRKALSVFHYCLNPDGYLFLGRAEAVAGFARQFAAVDKAGGIYRKVGAARGGGAATQPLWTRLAETRASAAPPPEGALPADARRQADGLLLARYAPPSVLVDEQFDIVQVRGRTSPYLELPPGEPNLNVLKLAREGLLPSLRSALLEAQEKATAVRRDGVEVRGEGGVTTAALEVVPVVGPSGARRFFLVLFTGAPPPAALVPGSAAEPREAPPTVAPSPVVERRVAQLSEELAATKQYLQTLLDERQRINEQLVSTNEELVSSVEELQSTNEELETAKEELQSTNEELTTVNDELQSRNDELSVLNDDLENVFANVDLPVVLVGADRRLRRFTPRATALMNVIPSDVGRPLGDIKPRVSVGDLDAQVVALLADGQPRESEVQDEAGRWFRLQLRPYRTVTGAVDGAVLTLLDVDALRRALSNAEAALDYVTGIVETARVPLVVLDGDLRVLSANRAYAMEFTGTAVELRGKTLGEAGWDVPALTKRLEELRGGAEFEVELEAEVPEGRVRRVSASGSRIPWARDPALFLLTLVDVTERSALLADAQAARAEAERANQAKDLFLATLSHELRTPLSAIILRAAVLQRLRLDVEQTQAAGAAIEAAARVQAQLIDDLLDISRIVAGRLKLDRRPVKLPAVVTAACDTVRASAEERSVRLDLDLDDAAGPVVGDPVRLQQVVWNLLTNAIKFTPKGGVVTVSLEREGACARLRVRDTGHGTAAEFLPHIFERFSQQDGMVTRAQAGLGLGLSIVKDLVELHGGTVAAESPGAGQGSTFTVSLPIVDAPAAGRASVGRAAAEPGTDELASAEPRALTAGGEPASRTGCEDLQGTRILMVDDDDGTRSALVALLAACGAEVRDAGSAAEALEALETFRPDVLLSDLAMPGQDGIELLRGVRALGAERGGQVPAVAVTALAARKHRERALAAGFQRYLVKPVTPEAVFDAVRSLARTRPGGG